MNTTEIGSIAFGLVVGWISYRSIRRKTGTGLSDIAGVIGAVGGGTVTALFKDTLFGFYSIGLAAGFFLYFILSLIISGREETGKFMGD